MSEYWPKYTKPEYLIVLSIIIAISQVLRGIMRFLNVEALIQSLPILVVVLIVPIVYISSNPVINFASRYIESDIIAVEATAEPYISASIQLCYALILIAIAYGSYISSKRLLKFGAYFFIFNIVLSILEISMIVLNIFEDGISFALTNICLMGFGVYLIYNIETATDIKTGKKSTSEDMAVSSKTGTNESQRKRDTWDKKDTHEGDNQNNENKVAIKILLSQVNSKQKKLIAGLGSILIAVGALLPWLSISFLGISKRGVDGDGIFTLTGSVVILLLLMFTKWNRRHKQLSLIVGILMMLFSFIYIIDPLFGVQVPNEEIARGVVNIGIGLYLTLLGSILVVFSVIDTVGSVGNLSR